jgi:hypothetical protein
VNVAWVALEVEGFTAAKAVMNDELFMLVPVALTVPLANSGNTIG